jgi:carbon storage regulator
VKPQGVRKDLVVAMLVLSRKRDEVIVINDDIRITIVDIRGDKVRLGIDAPKNVTVHRQEVYDAIKAKPTLSLQQRVEVEKVLPTQNQEDAE